MFIKAPVRLVCFKHPGICIAKIVYKNTWYLMLFLVTPIPGWYIFQNKHHRLFCPKNVLCPCPTWTPSEQRPNPAQKLISLGVSLAGSPHLDLNHCLSCQGERSHPRTVWLSTKTVCQMNSLSAFCCKFWSLLCQPRLFILYLLEMCFIHLIYSMIQ